MSFRPRFLSLFFAATTAAGASAAIDESAEMLAEAKDAYERGIYFEAADLLAEVLAQAPANVDASVLLMQVEAARGEIDLADEIDRDLATRFPEHAPIEVLKARADFAFDRGRLVDSEAFAREAVERAPDDLAANVSLARLLVETGRDVEVKAHVERALHGVDVNDLGSDDLLSVGRLYRATGEWEFAAQCCAHAEKRRKEEDRPTTDVLLELGDLYRLSLVLDGDTPRAFSTYRDALKQNGALVPAKVGRALVHLYVGDSWDAEKEVEEALAINSSSVGALEVKAWIRVLDGRHTEALDLIERALAVNPCAKVARAVRAAALYLLRRPKEFEEEVARILEIDPTFGEVYQTVGDALSRHLRFNEAIRMHERALEVDPKIQLALVSLGRDLCFAGREKEGLEALEKSYENHPYKHPWRKNMEIVLKKLDRDYVDAEDPEFRFRVHVDENQILGPRMAAAFHEDREILAAKYGWEPPGEVLVEMFPDHQDFSVRTVGMMGLGAVGACFGDFVTLLSPRSQLRRTFCYRRTILHELAHVFTIGRSKGRVPRWLTEGLSVYEERAARPTWGRDQELELLNAYVNDELMPLREFNKYFRGPRIGFAYYQGGLFAEFVERRHGFDKILALLDAYAEDLETPEAIERVFGVTCEEMDERFKQYLFETRLKDVKVQPTFDTKSRNEMRRRARNEPDDVDLLADLAWAYYQSRSTVDADVYLDKALKLDPAHGTALRLAARRSLDRNRRDLAQQQIETAFENGDVEYFAALDLARIYTRDEKHEAAERVLRVARECFPYDVGPTNPEIGLYQLLAAKGATEDAMAVLRSFVDRAETAVDERIELATWLRHQGRYDEALLYLREATETDPFVSAIYQGKAEVLREAGRPAEAIDALRTALLVDPRFEPGYDPRGGVNEDEDRRRRAALYCEIADIELEVGDDRAAERDLHEAMRLDPDSERVRELLDALKRS